MRLRTRLKFRAEYAAFRLAAMILGAISVERASNLSGGLWRRFAPRSRRHARALAHLAEAFPEKTAAEREAIALAMWENMGRNFGEAFHLRSIAANGRVRFEDEAVFRRWADHPGGKLACAGHLGNWEFAILRLTLEGLKPWSIYQKIKNPRVNAAVADMRGFLYTGGLVQKSANLPRTFLKVMREGGTIGFLVDLRDPSGIEVPFFGRPAPSTTFPALLARSEGVPILVARLRRLPGVRFVQNYDIVEVPVTGDRKADILAATIAIQAHFERYIRDAPEQWMWAHRRWG